MRNVFVVLVPLCIGLTSGFIVPIAIREVFDDDLTNINVNHIRTRETKPKFETTRLTKGFDETIYKSKTLCNKNNMSNKLEKDLYDDTSKKDNNINERSFVLIKQRAKQPFSNRFIVNVVPELNDDDKTRATYPLNKNNSLDEFHRRISVGITNTDKNVDDSNLILSKPENQNTVTEDMGFNKIYDSNFKYNNARSYSRGQRKYLVSYIKPFLKPYIEIARKATKDNLKPDVHHFRDVQQCILQSVSNKNSFKLAYPSGKTIDAIVNPNDGMYLINDNKKLSNGNSNDGQKPVERLIKGTTVNEAHETENIGRTDSSGLHHCPTCGEYILKDNSKSRMVFNKKCKCKTK